MKVLPHIILSLLLFYASAVHAQQVNREGILNYEREIIGGINFNTNGGFIGGFMFRYTRMDPNHTKMLHNFGLELGIVKHPKEVRLANASTGGTFIGYKTNHLLVWRPHYGREFLVFRKGNEDGVQLDWIINGGPSLAMLVPYMIEYDYGTSFQIEQFDPDIHRNLSNIGGNAGFTSGLGKSNFTPGIHIKTGFSFEYSHFDTNVTGIEVGFLLEAFAQPISMLEKDTTSPGSFKEYQTFTSIYINLFYGGRK
ncbi:MAG: hypothetical protein MUE33_09385 [Cytophagaceae bacterium]|jgi:hypothetical protein|nr:hypothetical protein [Cytophagaceae bacterium]